MMGKMSPNLLFFEEWIVLWRNWMIYWSLRRFMGFPTSAFQCFSLFCVILFIFWFEFHSIAFYLKCVLFITFDIIRVNFMFLYMQTCRETNIQNKWYLSAVRLIAFHFVLFGWNPKNACKAAEYTESIWCDTKHYWLLCY